MSNALDFSAIERAEMNSQPFPYFTVERSIQSDALESVIKSFPTITEGGSFNLNDVSVDDKFQWLIDSLDTPQFRELMSNKFEVDVRELPMMVTLRGISRKKDGRIHTDSKTKVLTILIYMNEEWSSNTGLLRILENGEDINAYVAEVTPGPGAMVGFKVTDNCWHGYIPYDGRRQSIQINFLIDESANSKHQFFHGLSAKFKAIKRKLGV